MTLLISFVPFMLFANNFSSYLGKIPYDSVVSELTPIEEREIEKITFKDGTPVYNDRIIRLYLVASGINTEAEFRHYFTLFEDLVQQAKELDGPGELNRYNMAERLLHFMHDEIFKTEITGRAAGYNIGVRETLDKKRFNCYKSALLYNALLEYFDYKSYLVLVPEHIYSVVLIDGRRISVETTNRFGFDTYNDGYPENQRKFDKPNVLLNRKNYRDKTPVDNVTVAGIIYNNLLLLYADQEQYPGYPVKTDMNRAALLGMLGLYITGDNKAIANNVQYPFFRLTEDRVKQDPQNLEKAYDDFMQIINHPYITAYSKPYRRNASILVLESLPAYRKSVYGDPSTLTLDRLAESYRDSLVTLEKLSLDRSITDSGWNNTVIQYMENVDGKVNMDSYEGVRSYITAAHELINDERLRTSPSYGRHRDLLARYATTELNNYIAALINSKNYRQAYAESRKGASYLRQLDFSHSATMRTLERNMNIVKDQMERN